MIIQTLNNDWYQTMQCTGDCKRSCMKDRKTKWIIAKNTVKLIGKTAKGSKQGKKWFTRVNIGH